MLRLAVFTGLVLGAACAWAQEKTPAETNRRFDIVAASQEPAVYFPLTRRERFTHYIRATYGPATLLAQPFLAAFTQATDVVPEWGRGADGYSKQLGFTVLNTVSQTTIENAASAALGEDNTYYRCSCTSFWQRTGHALASPLVARNNAGHKRVSFSRILGAYGGGLVTVPVLPSRYDYKGDGVRQGNYNYALNFPVALFREFWPDLSSKLHRRKS